MSLDLAIIDIGKNVFTGSGGYGQIYVALSRVRSLEGLSILNFDPTRIKCHPNVIEFYNNIDRPPTKNMSMSSSISTESEISLESDRFVIKVSKRSIDKIQETTKTKVIYNKCEKPDIRKYFTTLN